MKQKHKQTIFRIKPELNPSPVQNAAAAEGRGEPVPVVEAKALPQPEIPPLEPVEAVLKFSSDQLVQGIIFAEILGRPKSRRMR